MNRYHADNLKSINELVDDSNTNTFSPNDFSPKRPKLKKNITLNQSSNVKLNLKN